jgi:hypothetical protein
MAQLIKNDGVHVDELFGEVTFLIFLISRSSWLTRLTAL